MPRRWTNPVKGPEVDTVIEREAGLYSLSDAARLLGSSTAAVSAALDRGMLPDAFQTPGGHWRIPLADIVALRPAGPKSVTVAELTGSPETPSSLPHASSRRRSHARPRSCGAARRAHILEQLDDHRAVRVSRLSVALGVSEMTIRRDLDRLHAEGLVLRVFGGAIRPTDSVEGQAGACDIRGRVVGR